LINVQKLKIQDKRNITSSVYDCTVEDVEYSSHLVVAIVTHIRHLECGTLWRHRLCLQTPHLTKKEMYSTTKTQTPGPQIWIQTDNPGWTGITVRYFASRSTSVCGTQTHTKSLCSYKVFVRIGDVDVSWDSFLRPMSTRLWVVMAVCTVTMALALRICFQVDSGQREELRTDTRLQDLVFATFGAVFCLQGKWHAFSTYFKNCFCIKMRLCLNPKLGTDLEIRVNYKHDRIFN